MAQRKPQLSEQSESERVSKREALHWHFMNKALYLP